MLGNGESIILHLFYVVWAVAALPVSGILGQEHHRAQVGRVDRGFLSHSQNLGRIVGRPLPTKMRSLFPSFIPGHQRLLSILGHQHPIVYTRSSTSGVYTRSSTSSCLYQVINIFRLYQVIKWFLAYTRGSTLFTPVARVWWALLGPL